MDVLTPRRPARSRPAAEFAWIFPSVVLTNDPQPPSNILHGVVVENFAVIATQAVIMAGVRIGHVGRHRVRGLGRGQAVTAPERFPRRAVWQAGEDGRTRSRWWLALALG
jgi:hypothetical protein